jgi:hypothetical protein
MLLCDRNWPKADTGLSPPLVLSRVPRCEAVRLRLMRGLANYSKVNCFGPARVVNRFVMGVRTDSDLKTQFHV